MSTPTEAATQPDGASGPEVEAGRRRRATALREAARLLGVLLLSLVAAAATIALLGGDAGKALAAIHAGSIAYPRSLAESLVRAAPLILTGLAVAVAFRCGIFNIGAEGQFLLGMLGSTVAALTLPPLPPWIAAPICLLAGAAAGSLWALLPTVLKLRRQVPEVITTLMLNFLAVYLLEYLVRGPMRDPASVDDVSRALPAWCRLARIGPLLGLKAVGGDTVRLPGGQPLVALGVEVTYLHLGVPLALAVAVLVWVWLARSRTGFRLRAVGLGPAAAAAAGVPVARTMAAAFLTSGALAGLAGAVEQLGVISRMHRFAPGEPGYGFTGIAVALLAGLHPAGVVASAFFFGALRAGCDQMQRSAGVSFYVAYVIQAVVVLALLRGRKESA